LLCEKGTRAFIIISAGFGELNEEGRALDKDILEVVERYGASLLGPNCIGMIHASHHSVFTSPIPVQDPEGVEFISSSGSTAVFIMEAGMEIGLRFSNVYTVGNALQISVEDFLQYLDESYIHGTSSRVKMIYIENVGDPARFIRHASGLRKKGARVVALKAGMTESGARAASSHTGAMASPAVAVEAMFRKAGVIQCHSRQEMLYAAAILQTGLPEGRNMAVITHAGGAGVMLTDALEKGGMKVPQISGAAAEQLLEELYQGSSVSNPIDFLATGTAGQLATILDYCDQHFDHIDGMAVIFGSPGLFDVSEVYKLLDQKMATLRKPVYPVLPSPVNTASAIREFIDSGRWYFPDESVFGQVLSRVYDNEDWDLPFESSFEMDEQLIRQIIKETPGGYISPDAVRRLLEAAGIPIVDEQYASDGEELARQLSRIRYPIVMKVVGPVHKSDVGGVLLHIGDPISARKAFDQLMNIPDACGVLIQPMLKGTEWYMGTKREDGFGPMILFGMGGIFLEVYRDVRALIGPVSRSEVLREMKQLSSFPIMKGARGQEGVNLEYFAEIVCRISMLTKLAPEILEMDLNPLLAGKHGLVAVDARIRLDK